MTRTLLVPSSITREAEDKREATRKLGYVARAATVFRADRLAVFPDGEGETGRFDGGFVRAVLAYAATPPYLRKEAWGRRDELEYVGVLPPLLSVGQTGSGHRSGSSRQGIVTEVGADGRVRVNCGLQHPVSLPVPPGMAVEEGERVTVRVSSREPLRARLVDEPLPGLAVEETELSVALSRPDAGLRIATSRHGETLTVERLDGLVDGDGFTVAFGSPGRGLPGILGVDPDAVGDGARDTDEPTGGFDLWLDTVPNQGSETVRTEEAMFATLGALNLPRR